METKNHRKMNGKMKGFTLVELIVVITILVILGTIAFVNLGNFSGNARDSDRVTTIANIQKGLDLHEIKAGTYPLPENITGTGTIGGTHLISVGSIRDNISRIIKFSETPTDPLSGEYFVYGTNTTKTQYQIAVTLENPIAYLTPTLSMRGEGGMVIVQNTQAYKNPLNPPSQGEMTITPPLTRGGWEGFIVTSVHAASSALQARVIGNYNGLLKSNGKIYNLPSLIFTGSGELTSTGTFFVVDKGQNIPYKLDAKNPENSQTTTEALKRVTKKDNLTLTGITIPTNTAEWNTASGTLGVGLGYEIDTIGIVIYGNTYLTDINNLSVGGGGGNTPPETPPAPSLCGTSATQTVGSPTVATFASNLCSGTGTVIAWSGTGGITVSDTLSWTCQLGSATGSCNATYNKFSAGGTTCNTSDIFIGSLTGTYQVWAACNVGANTAHIPAIHGWTGTIVSADEPTRKLAYSGVINSATNFLGNYYQWGRNDPVNLLATGSAKYSSVYQTNGVTLGTGSGFILGTASINTWIDDANHNTSSGIVWTNSSNAGPCQVGYHIPTTEPTTVTPSLTDWRLAAKLIVATDIPAPTDFDTIRTILKLPIPGSRWYLDGSFGNQGSYGRYWSSSPHSANLRFVRYVYFLTGNGVIGVAGDRTDGFAVRCLKN